MTRGFIDTAAGKQLYYPPAEEVSCRASLSQLSNFLMKRSRV